MASGDLKTKSALKILQPFQSDDSLLENIVKEGSGNAKKSLLPVEVVATEKGVKSRLGFLKEQTDKTFCNLSGGQAIKNIGQLQGNIENYIGMAMVPTGVVGPVRVKGSAAKGDFYVPLSTTEGALVASYHRGAKACYLAGGATSICLAEGVQRSPVFKFNNLAALGKFLIWVAEHIEQFKIITGQASRYAKLEEVKTNIEGNHLILTFEFHTGDAAGQNMVTFCTDAICRYIIDYAPVKPVFWFVEGNNSGDKKATSLSFNNVRGKKVSAEIHLPEAIVREVLKSSSEAIHEYWRSSTIGAIQSGAIGAQGHYANGLAALFIATGQDVACVSEACVGITRMEAMPEGGLYACVTLPNLIVGTVGGGTALPTQKECLELMDCFGEGKSRKFAEICGALILAGELSIAAALSAGHFTSAHKKLGRKATTNEI